MAIEIPIQLSKDELSMAQNNLPTLGAVQQQGIDVANEFIILVLGAFFGVPFVK